MQQLVFYGLVDDKNQLVGVDESSGGYPWSNDNMHPHHIEWFHSRERRDKYNEIFKNKYHPVIMTIDIRPDNISSEIEL